MNEVELPLHPDFVVEALGEDFTPLRTQIADNIANLVESFAERLKLERLATIVIADTIDAALAHIYKGKDAPTLPEHDFLGTGGLAGVIDINGEEWGFVALATSLVLPLHRDAHPDRDRCLSILCHELVHIHDFRLFTLTVPGGWDEYQPRDPREANLHDVVYHCQNEYRAQRFCTPFLPKGGLVFWDYLGAQLAALDGNISAALRTYASSGDDEALWEDVSTHLQSLFQMLGYALGSLDCAVSSSESGDAKVAYETELATLSTTANGWIVTRCRLALEHFYDLQAWPGLDLYGPLIVLAEDILNRHGIRTSLVSGQFHVAVD